MSYKDYYQVIGVARGATAAEIQKRYRSLAKKYHPDVSKEPNAEARFKEIGEAYEVLKDQEKRTLYDKWGPHWRAISEGRQPPPGGPSSSDVRYDFGSYGFNHSGVTDVNSIFEQVFGGTGPGRSRGRRTRRADQETAIDIGVRQAFEGGRRQIHFADTRSGKKRRITVNIPAGVRDGQRIRLGGQASLGRGDLYLKVRIVADEDFRLEGDNVYVTLRIAPHEGALGTAAPLETLDGPVKVRVPPGSSSGRQIRLRQRGYPIKGGKRGDLFAEIQVVVPAEPSGEERRLYEQLSKVSTFDPRRR